MRNSVYLAFAQSPCLRPLPLSRLPRLFCSIKVWSILNTFPLPHSLPPFPPSLFLLWVALILRRRKELEKHSTTVGFSDDFDTSSPAQDGFLFCVVAKRVSNGSWRSLETVSLLFANQGFLAVVLIFSSSGSGPLFPPLSFL